MSNTELVIEFSKFLVPSLLGFGAFYYFTNRWVEVQNQKIKLASLKQAQPTPTTLVESTNAKTFLPLQIDAVQRLVLFLERISPTNLVIRLVNPGMPAKAFQQKLLENIRSEFEHNLAQQVYISSEAWQIVKNSKEEVVKIINMSATQLEPTALAADLGQNIFEIAAQLKQQPTEIAIETLKRELRDKI
ncbi:hypothetical protein DNU06_10725 [Putridiphycobacter roseus]|uniref:Uncharacterized protein n=1 Tax=Putridiphycobacter roseus TaxID=2219161 RepID=A0A2W1MY11_9FLAO|nr:hypothetical protein [Putridiphycobacter roseus]PZE16727.1 hypothetical protein DNU06_10725 [Putridiphycobacter roseus]